MLIIAPKASVKARRLRLSVGQRSLLLLSLLRFLMAQILQSALEYRRRLDAAVTAFRLFIHDLCPDVQIDISFVRYEDEDAHIWVSLPPHFAAEEQEYFANHMAEKSLDILLEADLLILAGLEDV
jgi:hypothetical protein